MHLEAALLPCTRIADLSLFTFLGFMDRDNVLEKSDEFTMYTSMRHE